MAPRIFDFTSLSLFLTAHSAFKKNESSDFSIRAWGRDLGLTNPALLVRVLAGDRPPNHMLFRSLLKYFKFEALEEEYFKNLVLRARAKADPVMNEIMEERYWPGLSPTSQKLPRSQKQSVLEINNGEILALAGTGSSSVVNALLKKMNLVAVDFGGEVPLSLNICDYGKTNLGPYREAYISILAKPSDENCDQMGLVFLNLYCNKPTISSLARIVWGNNYRDADVCKNEGPEARKNYHVFESNKEVFSFDVEKSEDLEPLVGDANLKGFANVFSALSLFQLDIMARKFEKPFDPSDSSFMTSPQSDIGNFLCEAKFDPQRWIFHDRLSCRVSSPAERVS